MPTPIGQLLTRTIYAADGVTTTWNFSFSGGYLDKSHVKALTETPEGLRTAVVVTEGMFTGPNTLQITPAIAVGVNLVIYRDTPKDLPLVNFTDEAGFSEVALDTNAKQAVFIAAETTDTVNTGTSYEAEQAAVEAAASAAAAAASYDAFDDRYLGAKSVNPTTDNDGNALLVGALYWNTVANGMRSYTGTSWEDITGVLAQVPATYSFNGTGVQVAFTLPTAPTSSKLVTVRVGGVFQEDSTYSVAGAVITFSEAPPVGTSNVDVIVYTPATAGDANSVSYTPAGTGAVATTVQAKLRESVSIKDFGAIGDGVADDTAAIQTAIAYLVSLGGGTLQLSGDDTYLLNGGVAGPDGYKNGVLIPFGVVNADPSTGITIHGCGARIKCGSNNMVLIRNSRNCTTLRDLTLDYNGKTGVYLCLTGPEDMTQTTALVSNSFATLENVNRVGGPGVDGLVFMPGPYVGGADSGAFYHNITGGYSNFSGGGRHAWARKNVDWASHPNWITRSNFSGQRLTRGNAGYHFEDGSQICFIGCNEEAINSGTTPLATPTARKFEAACDAIFMYGGYAENCTSSVDVGAQGVIESWGYKPASGSDAAWNTYAMSWADGANDNRAWVPVLNSSGGGSQGASTSFGRAVKQGKIVFFTAQISAAKGTLAAGTLSVSGLPFVSDATWTDADFQGAPVTKWSGITLGANWVALAAYISGASISIRKLHAAGASTAGLTLAECSDPVVFTVQGWYKCT